MTDASLFGFRSMTVAPPASRCMPGGSAFATALLFGLALSATPGISRAFESGSTGADLDLTPTISTEIQLPPSGVLNYRRINIPAGVTVTFRRNAANTPVTLLVQQDAVIAGIIDLSGRAATPGGTNGDGNLLDDGLPGEGGPGGYSGGHGGLTMQVLPPCAIGSSNIAEGTRGGTGLGPGGGAGGVRGRRGDACHEFPIFNAADGTNANPTSLLLLHGGGGGGGSAGGVSWLRGNGGGGGGGALLLAVSQTLEVSGSILANGGARAEFSSYQDDRAGGSGAGAGGSIRLVATRIRGRGLVAARGGNNVAAAAGRIRLEPEFVEGQLVLAASATIGTPSALFVPGSPSLRFVSVGGVPVPAEPTGNNDITLPATATGPQEIAVATTGIPLGSIVNIVATPTTGAPVATASTPTTGSLASAAATGTLTIPVGSSVLSATVTVTVVASVGDALSRYAQGQRVERITLSSTLGGEAKATLHTASGQRHEVAASVLALAHPR